MQAQSTVLTFECSTLVLSMRISRAGGAISCLAFGPTGQTLWAVTAQRQLLCLDVASGSQHACSLAAGQEAYCCASMGCRAPIACPGRAELSCAVDAGAVLHSVQEVHRMACCALAVDPLNRFLVTGGADCIVKLWEISSVRLWAVHGLLVPGGQRLLGLLARPEQHTAAANVTQRF